MSEKKNDMDFKEALAKLEATAETIKNPETSLEEAIKCYEEGMKYYQMCSEILDSAEKKVEVFAR